MISSRRVLMYHIAKVCILCSFSHHQFQRDCCSYGLENETDEKRFVTSGTVLLHSSDPVESLTTPLRNYNMLTRWLGRKAAHASGHNLLLLRGGFLHQAESVRSIYSQRLTDMAARVAQLEERVDAIEAQGTLGALTAFYATMPRTRLRLNEILEKSVDPLYRRDIFCHRELPILLAHMLRRLDSLPLGLGSMAGCLAAKKLLTQSFVRLTRSPMPDNTAHGAARFTDLVRELDDAHEPVVIAIAKGVTELKALLTSHRAAIHASRTAAAAASAEGGRKGSLAAAGTIANNSSVISSPVASSSFELSDTDTTLLQAALDEFYLTFLTYKFLSRQLVALADAGGVPSVGYRSCGSSVTKVGMVSQELDLRDVARKAAHQAEMICTEYYGDCPRIRILAESWDDLATGGEGSADDALRKRRLWFPHLEDTLIYVLVELLKNALRAIVETHAASATNIGREATAADVAALPPVVVRVSCHGAYSGTLTVSDHGGGIARAHMNRVFSYAYTTVAKPLLLQPDNATDSAAASTSAAPLAGYGYGLPMSRLYTRLFGGDLALRSMEGYGTDVIVTLAKHQ